MTNTSVQVSITTLISEIFNSIIQTASPSTSRPEVLKVPYQVGPGHFDSVEVTIPQVTIEPSGIHAKYEKELKLVFDSGIGLSELIFHRIDRDPFQVSFIEAVCDSCSSLWRRAHVISRHVEAVSNQVIPVKQILEVEVKQLAERVERWLLVETKPEELTIGISPRIGFPADTEMADWKSKSISFIDAALQPHRIFKFEGSEFSKVFHEDTFVLPLAGRIVDVEVANQIEEFRLSVCLSCKQPVEVVSATIRPSYWENAPGKRPNFSWHVPGSNRTPDVSSNVQFWASVGRENNGAVPTFWDGVQESHIAQQSKWYKYLKANQECQFGLSIVMDGAFLILQSMTEPVFRQNTIALRGLHLVLCGMEGIGGALDSSEEENSTRFKNFWERIWNKHLETASDNSPIRKTNNVRSALGQLYKLRNSLAHANRESLNFEIMCSKRAIGDFFNQGEWAAYSFGFCLTQIVFELIEELGN
jgi:hypothetical protein